jgi:hypothetical protein
MSTLTQLLSDVKQRCDIENSSHLSDAELTRLINYGYGELYDVLVTKFQDEHISSATFSTVSGTDTYSLTTDASVTDLYKLKGVDLTFGGETVTVRRFNFHERNIFNSNPAAGSSASYNMRYNLQGDDIVFMPAPTGAHTVKIWYIPQLTVLSAGGDSVSGQVMINWEEYIVIAAAIRVKEKREEDARALLQERAWLLKRIEESASDRDAGEAGAIVDVDAGTFGQWGSNF